MHWVSRRHTIVLVASDFSFCSQPLAISSSGMSVGAGALIPLRCVRGLVRIVVCRGFHHSELRGRSEDIGMKGQVGTPVARLIRSHDCVFLPVG
ncbi:hypothetical protein CA951_31350 [Rhodococcus sp. NCIMB 12038]|nr:hypothetical protein CA951_31350 [Rhodococcus sp. NCIMB 12038]